MTRADCEDNVESKLRRLNKTDKSKETVTQQISEQRERYLEQIESENLQIRELEKEIHETNQKLCSVNAHNMKFEEAVSYLESEISFMCGRIQVIF